MHPCNPLQAVSLTSFTSATSCKLSRRRLSLGTSEDLLNWNTISSFNTNTWYSSHVFSHVNNPSHEASSKKHTAKLYITKHNLESCTEVWLIGSNILHLPCWPKGTMTHLPVTCGSLWGLVFLVVNNPQFLDKEHQDHPIQGAYRLYKSLHHQPQVPSAWRIGVTSEKLHTWTLRGPSWSWTLHICILTTFWIMDLTVWYWRSAEKFTFGLNLLRTCRSFTRRSSRIKRSNRKSIRFPDDTSLVDAQLRNRCALRFNSTALSGACVRQRRGGKANWESELRLPMQLSGKALYVFVPKASL